jgi:hypothetical protein
LTDTVMIQPMKADTAMISELRTALRRRGVWSARAERLIQEWAVHVRDDTAQRIEKGADPDAAQEAARMFLRLPRQVN